MGFFYPTVEAKGDDKVPYFSRIRSVFVNLEKIMYSINTQKILYYNSIVRKLNADRGDGYSGY